MRWRANAHHLNGELVELEEWMVLALGRVSPSNWASPDDFGVSYDQALELLDRGLLIAFEEPGEPVVHARYRSADERMRETNWWSLAAVCAAQGRWSCIDSAADMEKNGTNAITGLVDRLGTPSWEPEIHADVHLSRRAPVDFDKLLRRRATCRSFPDQFIDLDELSSMMDRVFAATHVEEPAEGLRFLKRSSPSGGGLHATDAFLLIQRVTGLAPGLYRYLPETHALSRLDEGSEGIEQLAAQMVAGQHWFANAPVMVVLSPRYTRNFWKYRHHAKAYRAIVLEAGHLSQTLYMSATEVGLGAYVTCAINETMLEQVFEPRPDD